MKSPKELSLEKKIVSKLTGTALHFIELIFNDSEVFHLQSYANTVSITRLNYNDHGPVHMKKVALNAIKIMEIMNSQNFKFSLEKEGAGSYDDSLVSVLAASLLHDIGMSVGRDGHEINSSMLALPILSRILAEVYKDKTDKQMIVRSMALEGILGHMATRKIHSLEAGVILIADGCDMEKGRSRIPMMINEEPKIGDIHQYSSASIQKVKILKGKNKPLLIDIEMDASVGFFQVEEILLKKIYSSTLLPFIELSAGVENKEKKHYLN